MWKRNAISWDDLKRLRDRFDELISEVMELRAICEVLQTEWAETRDQVRRSYQRVEAAERRAKARASEGPKAPPDWIPDEQLDPFSRKIRQIREGGADAVQPGTDESAG